MASSPRFSIRALGKEDRSQFACGEEALDRYFRRQVSQDVKRRITSCFIAFDEDQERIAGFFTLSACHVDISVLDDQQRKRLPMYPEVPSVRLGRLAINENYQGQKLGGALLAEAVSRAAHAPMGIHMMVVDAKDETAAAFYRHHGFVPDVEMPLILYGQLAALIKTLEVSSHSG